MFHFVQQHSHCQYYHEGEPNGLPDKLPGCSQICRFNFARYENSHVQCSIWQQMATNGSAKIKAEKLGTHRIICLPMQTLSRPLGLRLTRVASPCSRGRKRHAGENKSRQTGTLKCSNFFISLERFGLGRPLTTHYEGLIEANRLTFNLIHLNNTKIY